jgi:hypothetical protein
VPILVPLLVPFFAIAAAIVLAGLQKTHTAQHGSATSTGFWQFLSSGLLKTLFGQVTETARAVVSRFAASQLAVLAKWLLGLGTLALGWFGISADFTEAITYAVERVMHRGDPRARAKAQTANAHAIHAGRTASHANTHARSVGHALNTYKARTNARIKPLHHATTVTLPHDIAKVRSREDALSRDLGKLKERTRSLEDGAVDTWDWIRSHPLSGVTAVFTGAVAIALARLGMGFIRCRNWQNVGKRLTCGMGAWVLSLLELIATFGLATVAVLDPEALARETVAAVDVVEPIIARILSD